MPLDLTIHVTELLLILGAVVRVVGVANRINMVLKDFPPHRHDNGNVIYPKGFEPTPIQRLNGFEHSAGK